MADFKSGANIAIIVNPYAGTPPVAGRYEIFTEIGSGPLGKVYVANDLTDSSHRVAIKVLEPRMSPDLTDPTLTGRYTQQARKAARLDRDDIVPVVGIDRIDATDGPRVAVVQTFETWPTLGSIVARKGALKHSIAVRIARNIARAVQAAHEEDILHLDLHPNNVFISPDADVRVSDFAIRGALQAEVGPRSPERGPYLAPEQQTGGAVGPATDVYAVALILQHMLTGEPPDPQLQRSLPRGLDLIIERATRDELSERLPSLEAFCDGLDAPAAYQTPVPQGVFVRPNVTVPSPLPRGMAAPKRDPLLLIIAGITLFLLVVLLVGVAVLLSVT